jgi:hypothetical protein
VAVVTALTVREWCGDWIAGGANLGTFTFTFSKLLIAGGGLLMSGRMICGSWSAASCFLAGALPRGLTTCLNADQAALLFAWQNFDFVVDYV